MRPRAASRPKWTASLCVANYHHRRRRDAHPSHGSPGETRRPRHREPHRARGVCLRRSPRARGRAPGARSCATTCGNIPRRERLLPAGIPVRALSRCTRLRGIRRSFVRRVEHRFGRGEVLERESDRLEHRDLVVARAPGMRAAREIGEIGGDVRRGQIAPLAIAWTMSPPSAQRAVALIDDDRDPRARSRRRRSRACRRWNAPTRSRCTPGAQPLAAHERRRRQASRTRRCRPRAPRARDRATAVAGRPSRAIAAPRSRACSGVRLHTLTRSIGRTMQCASASPRAMRPDPTDARDAARPRARAGSRHTPMRPRCAAR